MHFLNFFSHVVEGSNGPKLIIICTWSNKGFIVLDIPTRIFGLLTIMKNLTQLLDKNTQVVQKMTSE